MSKRPFWPADTAPEPIEPEDAVAAAWSALRRPAPAKPDQEKDANDE